MQSRSRLTAVLAPLLALLLALACGPVAGMASAPASTLELRQRIETSGDTDRELAVRLARQALAGPLNAEDKIWFLDRLATDLRRLRRWEDALSVARQGLALSGGDPAWRVRFATHLGYELQGLNRPLDALRIYDEQIAKDAPAFLKSLDATTRRAGIDALRMRGNALLAVPRRPEAMEQLTQVLRLYDELKDAQGQAETLHVIAALRYAGGDPPEAMRAEQQGIDIATQAQVKGVLAKMYMLKSYFQGQHDRGPEYERTLHAAREAAIEEGDDFIQAMVTYNLSAVAIAHKDWAGAMRLTDVATPIFLKIGDLNMADLSRSNHGIAMNRSGRPEGIELIRQANVDIAKRPGQEITLVAVQQALAEELAIAGDFKQAYAEQLEYQRRNDALRSVADQQRIADAEASYQADRKQHQIEELERERVEQQRFRWLWVLVGVLGVSTAAVVAVSRLYLKRAYRTMHDMALEDPLTGLHNRRYLSSRIGEELAQMRRQRLQPAKPAQGESRAAFLLIDIDHFKSINDEHGHAAGDAVLRQASILLRSLVRQSDTIVRWGGEEFLVFARIASSAEAGELAGRICTQMAAHEFDVGRGRSQHRTCSVGFACYPSLPPGRNASELPSWEGVVSLADQCLYAAKNSGRNLWVGIEYADGFALLPELPDAGAGVEQGLFSLRHSAGRTIQWPGH